MKRDRTSLLRLVSELESDVTVLDGLVEANRLMSRKIELSEPDQFDWAALGYTVHNLYNLMESYFLRIAKYFENDLDPLSWHRDLVRRMSLDIEDIRPALLSTDAAALIDELRAFRHVFRNIYQSALDPRKTAAVNAVAPRAVEAFRRAHTAYVALLRELARKLDAD
jgi:hypothetical protein